MIEPQLHGAGFPAHLDEFRDRSIDASAHRGTAARYDIETSEWAVARAIAIMQSEALNPRTGKPWTWTAAVEYAKDEEEYRRRQRESLEMHGSAERAEAEARAAWLACRYLIAVLEGSPRASPEMLPSAKEKPE